MAAAVARGWLAPAICALPLATVAADWSYGVGEERRAQQASLCADEASARLVAEVFRREGPRPGYEALVETPGCRSRVATFTPSRVIDEVRIAVDEGDSYVVHFVEVDFAGGGRGYLVTTRPVRR